MEYDSNKWNAVARPAASLNDALSRFVQSQREAAASVAASFASLARIQPQIPAAAHRNYPYPVKIPFTSAENPKVAQHLMEKTFGADGLAGLAALLAEKVIVAPGGIFVAEVPIDATVASAPGRTTVCDRVYGKTRLVIRQAVETL